MNRASARRLAILLILSILLYGAFFTSAEPDAAAPLGVWECELAWEGEEFVYRLTLSAPDAAVFQAGWKDSEWVAAYAGTYSPSGEGLALELTDVETGESKTASLAFELDGDRLLVTAAGGDALSRLDPEEGPMEFRRMPSADRESRWVGERFAFASVGEELAIVVAENRTTPVRWRVAVANEGKLAPIADEYVPDPNPDGAEGVGGERRLTFLAVSDGMGRVDLYRAADGEESEGDEPMISYFFLIVGEETGG